MSYEGISAILIKMFNEMVRELKDVRCSSIEEEFELYWNFGGTGP